MCRNAIIKYIDQRGGEYKIFNVENLIYTAKIDYFKKDNKRLHLIQIQNNEDFNLVLDRMLYWVSFKSEEKKIEVNYQYSDFRMRDESTGFMGVGNWVEMDDKFKPLLNLIEENIPITCRVHGECYFHSKKGIGRSNFFVETKLEVVN